MEQVEAGGIIPTACSYALYIHVLYYHCLTEINTDIKEVLFNFSLCKSKESENEEVVEIGKRCLNQIGTQQSGIK